MKGEFGPPQGARGYYMVRNAEKPRSTHLFWYLDKICLLAKTAYMRHSLHYGMQSVEWRLIGLVFCLSVCR